MARRVLVPLDGSKRSDAILPVVERICGSGDEIVLFSVARGESPTKIGTRSGEDAEHGSSLDRLVGGVVSGRGDGTIPDLPVFAETGGQALQRTSDELIDHLDDHAAKLRRSGFLVETECAISNHPDEAIIRRAESKPPTLIAMATRSRRGIAELVFGSTSSAVVRSGVAPVLLVCSKDE